MVCLRQAGAYHRESEVIIATIYAFDAPVDPRFVDFFENTMIPLLRKVGEALLGHFVTEPAENTYPALPVREGENVFIWFASFADEQPIAAIIPL